MNFESVHFFDEELPSRSTSRISQWNQLSSSVSFQEDSTAAHVELRTSDRDTTLLRRREHEPDTEQKFFSPEEVTTTLQQFRSHTNYNDIIQDLLKICQYSRSLVLPPYSKGNF